MCNFGVHIYLISQASEQGGYIYIYIYNVYIFWPPLIPVYNKNSSFPIQLVCISYMTKSLDMYYWNNEGAGLAGGKIKDGSASRFSA